MLSVEMLPFFRRQLLHQRIPHALHDRPVYLPLVRHWGVNRADVVRRHKLAHLDRPRFRANLDFRPPER